MTLQHPRSTLFPYTTLFRSHSNGRDAKSLWALERKRPRLAAPGTVALQSVIFAAWKMSDWRDRKSTRLNSSHVEISYAVFCLKKKNNTIRPGQLDNRVIELI